MRRAGLDYRLASGGLLLLTLFVMFWNLAGGGLRNGDEARYAIVAENILHTGDWVTLHYLDEPYFQKSPARFWLSAALFRVAGSSAFTVRFWSALFGLGSVWLTVLIGSRLYGRWPGLLAGFILATTPAFLFVHGARTGEMDTAVTFFWLLALWPLLGDELRAQDVLLSVAACALAGLFKHLAYTPVVLLNVAVVLLVRGRWQTLPMNVVWRSGAILLVILGPWYGAQWALHGDLFWHVIWGRVVTGTAFQAAETSATHGPAYYLGVLGAGAWPWTLLVPPALVGLVAAGWGRWRQWVPWLMLGVLLAFVTISQRKLSWYAIPGYAAVALLAAGAVGRACASLAGRWGGCWPGWWALAAGVAVSVGCTTAGFVLGPAYQVPLDWVFLGGVRWLGAGLVLAVLLAAGALLLPRLRLVVLVGAGLALGAIGVRNAVAPVLAPGEPPAVAALAADVNPRLGPGEMVLLGVLGAGPRDDVSLYYLRRLGGRPGHVVTPDVAWAEICGKGSNGAVVLSREQYRVLSRRKPAPRQLKMLGAGAGFVVLGRRE